MTSAPRRRPVAAAPLLAVLIGAAPAGCGDSARRRLLTSALEQVAAAHFGPCTHQPMGSHGNQLVSCTGNHGYLNYAVSRDGTVGLVELSSPLPVADTEAVLAGAVDPLLTASERGAMRELITRPTAGIGPPSGGSVTVGDTSIEVKVQTSPDPYLAVQIRWRARR